MVFYLMRYTNVHINYYYYYYYYYYYCYILRMWDVLG